MSRQPEHLSTPLPSGGRVQLRALRPGESGPVEAVFRGMSPRARQQRYLVGVDRLSPAMLRALTDVDGERHVAWLARLRGRPVGVARYVLEEPGVAEVALEVVDAHHGAGIGTVLLDAVTTVAAARGVQRLRAYVLPSNQPSTRLLARVGIVLAPAGELLEGEGALRLLEPSRLDRRAVVELALRGSGEERARLLATPAAAS